MNMKKNVLIVFGGESSEHEISRISAESLLNHIDRECYNVQTAGITKDGRWFLTEASPEEIADGSWELREGNSPLMLSLDKSGGRFLTTDAGGIRQIDTDVVFPVLHGKNGEDGRIQGMLRMADLPFVGSDTASSAACMDKGITKALVEQADVANQAKCCIIHRSNCDPDEAAENVEVFFKGEYPLFVKPSSAGSSVGISKVRNRRELVKGIKVAFEEDRKIIVEEAIVGRELEVAVLGNEDAEASEIGEIFPAHEFYDYDAKYSDCGSKTAVAEGIDDRIREEIIDTALKIYTVMDCSGLARVDFFLKEDGTVVFNEINTIPGFTKISMYPKLWETCGIPYKKLIGRLIELALEKQE